VEEVAELLRHTPSGVRSMIRRGRLRALKVGGRYLIPESALDELGLASIRIFDDIEDPTDTSPSSVLEMPQIRME